MTNNQKAIDLLRQFATHQSTGLRGVVRIKRLQEEAVALLTKMGKLEPPPPNPYLSVNMLALRETAEEGFRKMYLNEWAATTGKLVELGKKVCQEYDRRCDQVEYKTAHGGLAWSRSTLDIRREIVDAAYPEAVNLGYEGTLQAWVQFVWDLRAPEPKEPR